MIPVRTRASNLVFKGDGGLVADAWVERRPEARATILTWKPSAEEREAIANGALIDLAIMLVDRIPPTMIHVSDLTELSQLGVAIRDRGVQVLAMTFPDNPPTIPPGWWFVSGDVYEDMLAGEAFDPPREDGETTFYGRLVKHDPDAGPNTMRYVRAPDVPERPKLVRPN